MSVCNYFPTKNQVFVGNYSPHWTRIVLSNGSSKWIEIEASFLCARWASVAELWGGQQFVASSSSVFMTVFLEFCSWFVCIGEKSTKLIIYCCFFQYKKDGPWSSANYCLQPSRGTLTLLLDVLITVYYVHLLYMYKDEYVHVHVPVLSNCVMYVYMCCASTSTFLIQWYRGQVH